jgi:hypothetical protein
MTNETARRQFRTLVRPIMFESRDIQRDWRDWCVALLNDREISESQCRSLMRESAP